MSTRFFKMLKAIVLCGIFVIIGANLYTHDTGFTLQNIVGVANIVFFGCLALLGIYGGIKQGTKKKQSI
jgi:hypothetical protein